MIRKYSVTLTRVVTQTATHEIDANNGRDAVFQASRLEAEWQPVSEKISVETCSPVANG